MIFSDPWASSLGVTFLRCLEARRFDLATISTALGPEKAYEIGHFTDYRRRYIHACRHSDCAADHGGNLFDTKDDPTNPQDDTYLPLSVKQTTSGHNERCDALSSEGFYRDQCKTLDWSDTVFSAKLQRLADVILAMPALPDVIVMPETENQEVLQELVSRHLADKRYEVIQLDTSDEPISRGLMSAS
jgi:hypothetical protein